MGAADILRARVRQFMVAQGFKGPALAEALHYRKTSRQIGPQLLRSGSKRSFQIGHLDRLANWMRIRVSDLFLEEPLTADALRIAREYMAADEPTQFAVRAVLRLEGDNRRPTAAGET